MNANNIYYISKIFFIKAAHSHHEDYVHEHNPHEHDKCIIKTFEDFWSVVKPKDKEFITNKLKIFDLKPESTTEELEKKWNDIMFDFTIPIREKEKIQNEVYNHLRHYMVSKEEWIRYHSEHYCY